VIVGGRNVARLGRSGVAALRRTIGMVFQDAKLLPTLRVLENVAIAAEVVGESPRESRRRAFHLLRELGLKDLIDRRPPTLSSGEQQRVALARALVNRPALLLADEPTGNLDPESSSRVLDLVVRAHRDGATVIVATHDEDLIRAVPARVVVLHRGRLAGADDGGEESDADPPALAAASDRWVLR
jgi:cell division transport system ATP-binding protein